MTARAIIAILSVATLAAAFLAYLERASVVDNTPGNPGAEAESAPARAAVAGTSGSVISPSTVAAAAGRHPLQDYLLSMRARERNSVLHSMLRDAGSSCSELIDAMQMAEATAVWRISCVNAHAYVLEVNSLGETHIDPVSYSEGSLPNPGQPNVPEPDEGLERLRPRN